MKLSTYAKHLGISYDTAWRMWRRGELAGQQLPSGTIIVEAPVPATPAHVQKVAVYARVSSAENRMDLESQAERVVAFSDTPRGLKPHGFSGYARPNGPR